MSQEGGNNTIMSGLTDELRKLNQAAHNVGPLKDNGCFDAARLGFLEGSMTSKFTVLGGASSGVALFLRGVRDIRSGFTKNDKGKRDLVSGALGVVEIASGAFVTASFYERVKMNTVAPTENQR